MSNKIIPKLSVLILTAIILNSCYLDENGPFNRIEGDGPTVVEEIDIPRVHGIVVRNSAHVILSQGSNQKLVIEAQRNILNNIKTDVSNGILYIGNQKPVWRTRPVEVKLRLSDLSIVKLSGSGSIHSEGMFSDLDDLEVRISGSGDISLEVEAHDVNGIIGGSGNISLEGEAREAEFIISGSGSIYAFDLQCRRAYARISGSGGINLDVRDDLEARISGSGNITYRGNPDIEKRISGSGHIRSR